MTIDLHGYSVDEATSLLMNALFEFENSNEDELVIITGKGKNIMFLTTVNFLDQENCNFIEDNGKVIVYK